MGETSNVKGQWPESSRHNEFSNRLALSPRISYARLVCEWQNERACAGLPSATPVRICRLKRPNAGTIIAGSKMHDYTMDLIH